MEPRSPSNTPEPRDAGRAGAREALTQLLELQLPDLRAFVRLRLGPSLRAVASATDVTQSVCADLLQDVDTFEYQGEAQFRSWLRTAVLNKIRNLHRARTAPRRSPSRGVVRPLDEALSEAYGSLCSPSHHAIAREQVELLERAFVALPAHYREVLKLAKIIGLPHEEIAARMARTVPATRNLLARALSRLGGEMARLSRS